MGMLTSLPSLSSQTGLAGDAVDGPSRSQMEEGPINYVEERRLKEGSGLSLVNGGRPEAGGTVLMEPSRWSPGQPPAAGKAHLEDVRNLVAFSAVAEAVSSYRLPPPGSPSLLYEKFDSEMSRGGLGTADGVPRGEDLHALKAALALAKHGVKPPNCNCDGPECPDYLEWLEQKIKTALGEELASPRPRAAAIPPPPPPEGAIDPQPVPEAAEPCPPDGLPFSQSALTIAKEKNISLQTAIAIEALTQLSAALPQPAGDGQPPPPPTIPFGPSPLGPPGAAWQRGDEPRYPPEPGAAPEPFFGAAPPRGNFTASWGLEAEGAAGAGDPMAELEQLLGNADDYIKAAFKRPEATGGKVAAPKTEPPEQAPSREAPGGPRLPPAPPEPDLHKKTQLVLQQHLHHKRSLFLEQSLAAAAAPPDRPGGWWAPSTPAVPPKPFEKQPKEKKKKTPPEKPPPAKPLRKQVQIKKAKQKDSQPLFPPLWQISLEGFRAPAEPPAEPPAEEMQTELPPPPPAFPHQPLALPLPASCPPPPNALDGVPPASDSQERGAPGGGPQIHSAPAGSTGSEEAAAGPPPATSAPIMVDDKLEELIRQFEAEFGENFNLPPPETPAPLAPGTAELPGGPAPAPQGSPPAATAAAPAPSSAPQAGPKSVSPGKGSLSEPPFTARSPKQIKIESSGAITVVSTTCFYSEESQNPDTDDVARTPTKDEVPLTPTLSGFLESPLKYLDTPTKSLLDTPAKRAQAEFPTCDCVGE